MNYRGLSIPFVDFGGGVTSDSLFCDKEQALFNFYEVAGKTGRYKRALDIGANIGVHSILMARQGWEVLAFEPDPVHFLHLMQNMQRHFPPTNSCKNFKGYGTAVSDHDGSETFVRVKGNTTGSHLKGDKVPYGELEEFEVNVVDCRPLFSWATFAKIDCEGHEARLLLTVTPEQARATDFMVEVGNQGNADAIFNHFRQWFPYVRMWAQQSGWQEVVLRRDMPTHHSHGALFIGRKEPFPKP